MCPRPGCWEIKANRNGNLYARSPAARIVCSFLADPICLFVRLIIEHPMCGFWGQVNSAKTGNLLAGQRWDEASKWGIQGGGALRET